MEITIDTELGEFDLEIDITHIEPFEPARMHPFPGNDSSGGEIEYDIQSAIPSGYETMKMDFKEWTKLGDEEKEEHSNLTMKCLSLKNNYTTESEDDKILQAINVELISEAKYAMEP